MSVIRVKLFVDDERVNDLEMKEVYETTVGEVCKILEKTYGGVRSFSFFEDPSFSMKDSLVPAPEIAYTCRVATMQSSTSISDTVNNKRKHDSLVDKVQHGLQSGNLDGDTLEVSEHSCLPIEAESLKPGHNKVFVRRIAYHLLWIFKERIRKDLQGILISGPPGCGKSWCSQFFVYSFLKDGHTVVYECVQSQEVWVLHTDASQSRRCSFPANKMEVPELNDPKTIYIYDCKVVANASNNEPVKCVAKKAMFSSANASAHKQTQRELLTLCYITPSVHELFRAAEIFGRDDVDVRKSFCRFGGSMRLLFDQDELGSEQYISACCKQLHTDNIDYLVCQTFEPTIAYVDRIPTAVFSTFLKPDALTFLTQDDNGYDLKPTDEQSLLLLTKAYLPENVIWRIATDNIFEQLRAHAHDDIGVFLARFAAAAKGNPCIGVTRGMSIQGMAPAVLADGGVFVRRKLVVGAAEHQYELPPRQLTWYKSDKVDPVLRLCLDPGTLFAINGKLPAFDLYIPPATFMQATSVATPRHNIHFEAAAKISKHCEELGLRAEFIFIVPDDQYVQWQRPQSFAIGKAQFSFARLSHEQQAAVSFIDQYVLKLPVDAWVQAADSRAAAAEAAAQGAQYKGLISR